MLYYSPAVAFFALFFSAVIHATPLSLKHTSTSYALKSFHHVPRKWKKINAAPPQHVISLQIGLRQGRFGEILEHVDQVSDPRHFRYGQHLSAKEIEALLQPTAETSKLVTTWLVEHGIDPSSASYSPAGDWIKLDLPVEHANRLLGCEYSVYQHEEEGTRLVRTPEWSLPEHLHDHIDLVEPTNSFMRPMKKTPRSTVKYTEYVPDAHEDFSTVAKSSSIIDDGSIAAVCSSSLVTPNCLRTLYGTINYTAKAENNRMSIANYLGEVNLRSDLQIYLSTYRKDISATAANAFAQVSIEGGTVQQTPLNSTQVAASTGVEGNLDVQTMIGIAYPVPLVSYSTGGKQPGFKPDNFTRTNTNEPYLAWVNYVSALDDDAIPYVVSTSYADDEQTVSKEYAIKVCNAFAALGARGVSLLFGSGDEGVGGNGDCFSNSPPYQRTFLPEFPTTCPYVTSVGGTYRFNPEIAAYDGRFTTPFTSGGGFSYYFPRPEYQDVAVSAYLDQNMNFSQYADFFNTSGRAYPDIAAQSVNFSTIWNGQSRAVDGTSAATPAAAAVIALVNDALLSAGKKTLGFLNPWLYQGGYTAFTDVLQGSAAGCEVPGFTAGVGWDAVTGFGTPNFQKILENLGVSEAVREGAREGPRDGVSGNASEGARDSFNGTASESARESPREGVSEGASEGVSGGAREGPREDESNEVEDDDDDDRDESRRRQKTKPKKQPVA